jgi:hypothetical protein
MKNNNYNGKIIAYCMLIVHFRFSVLVRGFLLILLLCAVLELNANAKVKVTGEDESIVMVFDEIPIRVIVEGYKNFYVDAIYSNNKLLYINVEDLFKMLEIPCVAGQMGNSLSGFIEYQRRTYLIDYSAKQLKIGDKIIYTKNRLVKETGELYLESSLLAEAFGLLSIFSFRSLSLQLKPDFELPAIRQLRIEKMRSNLAKLKGEEVADTAVNRSYHFFKFGMLDWGVASVQTLEGATENHIGLALGTEMLYGEADMSINYYTQYKFDNHQFQYLWTWVDNDKKIIKQAKIGKIPTQPISYLDAPVVGAVVRNTPTTIRKATGYYAINEFTEPNWTVELFINNVLVDYTQADASGLFTFKVPIVYGYTTLKLKFYGIMGEERTEERTMNVPYTVMPAGEFEYSLATGLLQDTSRSHYSKAEMNYGINQKVTVGGGAEYLSSVPNSPFIPYATATIQPFAKLTINGEYAHGVRTSGLLNYYLMRDVLVEIDYTKYRNGQLATRFNAPEERKVRLSVPFRYKIIHGIAKINFTQLVYSAFNYNQAYLTFSAYFKQFSANSTSQFNWINNKPAFVTTDLTFSYRLNNGYTIRAASLYNLSGNKPMSFKAAIERNIPKGNISVSYERNVIACNNLISVNLRYDLPFVRSNISALQSNGRISMAESAQGSLAFGSGNNYLYPANSSAVSKGGISLYPFLDLNQNGVFDKGENMVKINSVNAYGGKMLFSENDSIVRITNLNAFTNYLVEFKDNDLQNISWRFKYKRYKVLIDPNQFKRIDIPVIPVGEVSGMTYLDNKNTVKGIGRVLVKIYKKNGLLLVAETLSESDGYIYYLGLEPDDYIARIDSVQLSNLKLSASPPQVYFTLKAVENGDMVSGIDFVIRSVQLDSLVERIVMPVLESEIPEKNEVKKLQPANMLTQMDMRNARLPDIPVSTGQIPVPRFRKHLPVLNDTIWNISKDTLYKVQLLAVRKPIKDYEYFAKLLANVPGLTIGETLGEDGLYHYSTMSFKGISEATSYQRIIKQSGWKDCFVATYAGERRTENAFRLRLIKSQNEAGKKIPSEKLLPAGHGNETPVQEKTIPATKQMGKMQIKKLQIANHAPGVHLAGRVSLVKDTLLRLPGDPFYKVQILALRVPIRVKGYFEKLSADVPGLSIEEMLGEDGLYHYSSGAFNSIAEAREIMQLIILSGWQDCFIAVYSEEKRAETTFRIKHSR